jgi:uncharacterized protein YhaN
VARDEASLADVRVRLDDLVQPLGMDHETSAEEITRGLEALRELFKLTEQRADVVARAKAAEAEARAFEGDVARAVGELAPDLTELAPREAAAALVVRGKKAEATAEELAGVVRQLGEMSDADVPGDIATLVADEESASRASDEIDLAFADVEHEISRLDQSIGGMERGLESLRGDSHAADAAADAEEALARVRTHAERYCRAKLAAVVLGREIERYREENQGPLLSRAGSLFAELTLGAYSGVRAGFDDRDKPALLCVRAGGVEVDVGGLSEGTRDQLYLALRLASLQRYAEIAEPMPLVLDDVLVQLDDERARAALSVLMEMATRMQILFFTHHARLVELAREAAAPGFALHVHELASPVSVLGAPREMAPSETPAG